jgi:hypothetical protein
MASNSTHVPTIVLCYSSTHTYAVVNSMAKVMVITFITARERGTP